jgi:uncharacterized protein YecT (DUF1311 family)
MKQLLYILFLCFSQLCFSQKPSETQRIKSLSYMRHASKTDCDSLDGNNLQHRICLNFEFQSLDSIMNQKLQQYLKTISEDSLKNQIILFQNLWVVLRDTQSKIKATDFTGNLSGIYYLSSMNYITRMRIEELDFLLID